MCRGRDGDRILRLEYRADRHGRGGHEEAVVRHGDRAAVFVGHVPRFEAAVFIRYGGQGDRIARVSPFSVRRHGTVRNVIRNHNGIGERRQDLRAGIGVGDAGNGNGSRVGSDTRVSQGRPRRDLGGDDRRQCPGKIAVPAGKSRFRAAEIRRPCPDGIAVRVQTDVPARSACRKGGGGNRVAEGAAVHAAEGDV